VATAGASRALCDDGGRVALGELGEPGELDRGVGEGLERLGRDRAVLRRVGLELLDVPGSRDGVARGEDLLAASEGRVGG
jgi:hypothetical protein